MWDNSINWKKKMKKCIATRPKKAQFNNKCNLKYIFIIQNAFGTIFEHFQTCFELNNISYGKYVWAILFL